MKREKEFLDIVWILGNDIYVRNLILDGFYYKKVKGFWEAVKLRSLGRKYMGILQ